MREVRLTNRAFEDIEHWTKSNPKMISKIWQLIDDAARNHPHGIGKTEKLLGREDAYSKRITEKDRLVYSIKDDVITIHQCLGHYDDK